jgi:Mrr N-terminal domain
MEIEIDNEVFGAIKANAEPFVDTPNTVLRRLLGIDGDGDLKPRASSPPRAPAGSILPESEYELPILRELLERGGSGQATEVTTAVGKRLADRLTELDREKLDSGGVRWRNRVQFTRLTLKERGLIKKSSQRGVWELTDEGRVAAESGKASL